jgi:uncharacterized protein YwqG
MFWKRQAEKDAEILLKRQVPISPLDDARSWLGGLPKVPLGTAWPRNSKGAPLHFLAQVACEDFPKELWSGLGPRSGWLLLFVNALDLDGLARHKEVQVIHVEGIGPETEPPEDCPTVRHSMLYSPLGRNEIENPSVPKLWRKWPVDFVCHEYEAYTDPAKKAYPLNWRAEEIYDAPVSDRGIIARDFDLDRPLTWRGALYVIHGILNEVGTPEKFKRDFVGMKLGVVDSPPEPDQDGFNKEFERRRQDNPDFKGGDWSAWGDARVALNQKMKAERRTGWMVRARPALEADIAQQQRWHAAETKHLDANRRDFDDVEIKHKEFHLNHRLQSVQSMEEDLTYLDALLEIYPGAEGERKLMAEFAALGEAHLERGNRMIERLEELRLSLLDHDLESPLSQREWDKVTSIWEDTAGPYWTKGAGKLVQKVEQAFRATEYVEAAIREDMLDLYAQDNKANVPLQTSQLSNLEMKVRYFLPGARHQIGGQLIPVQSELSYDPSSVLLFQIASDSSIGWMWGDVGVLYVTIGKNDLKTNRFERLNSWLECH